MPIKNVLKIKVISDFAGKKTIISMVQKLLNSFKITVFIFIFDIGEALLIVIIGILNIHLTAIPVKKRRILEMM